MEKNLEVIGQQIGCTLTQHAATKAGDDHPTAAVWTLQLTFPELAPLAELRWPGEDVAGVVRRVVADQQVAIDRSVAQLRGRLDLKQAALDESEREVKELTAERDLLKKEAAYLITAITSIRNMRAALGCAEGQDGVDAATALRAERDEARAAQHKAEEAFLLEVEQRRAAQRAIEELTSELSGLRQAPLAGFRAEQLEADKAALSEQVQVLLAEQAEACAERDRLRRFRTVLADKLGVEWRGGEDAERLLEEDCLAVCRANENLAGDRLREMVILNQRIEVLTAQQAAHAEAIRGAGADSLGILIAHSEHWAAIVRKAVALLGGEIGEGEVPGALEALQRDHVSKAERVRELVTLIHRVACENGCGVHDADPEGQMAWLADRLQHAENGTKLVARLREVALGLGMPFVALR